MEKSQLVKALKLSFVPRWTIIDLLKSQNVSDHVYRTQIIVVQLIDKLSLPLNKEAVVFEALMHDIEEGETGDTPSTCKDTSYNMEPSTNQTKALLRLADTIEAAIWLQRYGLRPHRVMRFLEIKIQYAQKEISKLFDIPVNKISSAIDNLITIGREHD